VSREFIGLDVGGTKIAAARVADGEIVAHGLHPMDAADTDALLEELVSAIESMRTDEVEAVGIGVPSVVEFETGRARSSVNVPLADFPLRSYLTDRIGLPTFVDNDASVAALAEACEGGTDVSIPNLVMFTVGTGVGGGLVLGGRPYRGATGASAEVGHTLIGVRVEKGAPEPGRFPQEGSLESLAAGSALDALARESVAGDPGSYLGRRKAAGDEEITGHDVVDGAKAGDAVAIGLLKLLGERLGIGIANAINVFDPDVVAIGGGVSSAGKLLLDPAVGVARGFTLPGVGEKTEIRLSKHGTRGGVLGAALLAMHELKRTEEAADG
jgi:glucokinase